MIIVQIGNYPMYSKEAEEIAAYYGQISPIALCD